MVRLRLARDFWTRNKEDCLFEGALCVYIWMDLPPLSQFIFNCQYPRGTMTLRVKSGSKRVLGSNSRCLLGCTAYAGMRCLDCLRPPQRTMDAYP